MLTIVRGIVKPACDAKCRGAVTHNAIKGQSLLQSGSEGFSGQHGMSFGAAAATRSAAVGSPVDASMSIDIGTAITVRAIGASAKPAITKAAKTRLNVDRTLIE
jgi:hypothetical protein